MKYKSRKILKIVNIIVFTTVIISIMLVIPEVNQWEYYGRANHDHTVRGEKTEYIFDFNFPESKDNITEYATNDKYVLRSINERSENNKIESFAIGKDLIAIQLENSTIEIYDFNGNFIAGYKPQDRGKNSGNIIVWDEDTLLEFYSSGTVHSYDKNLNYIGSIDYETKNDNTYSNWLSNRHFTRANQSVDGVKYELKKSILGGFSKLVAIDKNGVGLIVYNSEFKYIIILSMMILYVIIIFANIIIRQSDAQDKWEEI